MRDGTLASASTDASIKFWNTVTGTNIRTLKGHASSVLSLALLTDGSLASGSSDKTIKIWNTINGNVIRTLTGHTDAVLTLAVQLDGYINIF